MYAKVLKIDIHKSKTMYMKVVKLLAITSLRILKFNVILSQQIGQVSKKKIYGFVVATAGNP